MKWSTRLFKFAVLSGSCASVTSALALFHSGIRDCRSAFAPVNAVSHWLWDETALREHEASFRYSMAGYCIHHAASIFWALVYEKLARRRHAHPTTAEAVASAAAIAALACVVDMRCTPKRLTPGFERRLSNRSLVVVYTAFGVGLALHSVFTAKYKR